MRKHILNANDNHYQYGQSPDNERLCNGVTLACFPQTWHLASAQLVAKRTKQLGRQKKVVPEAL